MSSLRLFSTRVEGAKTPSRRDHMMEAAVEKEEMKRFIVAKRTGLAFKLCRYDVGQNGRTFTIKYIVRGLWGYQCRNTGHEVVWARSCRIFGVFRYSESLQYLSVFQVV